MCLLLQPSPSNVPSSQHYNHCWSNYHFSSCQSKPRHLCSKNRRHDFASRKHLPEWCIHVSSMDTYGCKKSFLLWVNSAKQLSHLSNCCCFCSTESIRGIHSGKRGNGARKRNFFMLNSSRRILNTLWIDISVISAISAMDLHFAIFYYDL